MKSLDAFDAAETGDVEFIRNYIAGAGSPDAIDYRGVCLLHHAIEHRKPEIVKLLLAAGANANVVDFYGVSPLFHAIDSESDAASQLDTEPTFETVEVLLRAGARFKLDESSEKPETSILRSWYDRGLIEMIRKYYDTSSDQ